MYSTSAMFKYLMAEPSRTLTTRGTITYPDTATQALTAEEISSISITEDAGAHLPLGGVSASSLTLNLDNREGEWNAGGSILSTHSLDGAVIDLEIGIAHPDYTATPETVDGGAPGETFTESYDGGAPDEVFAAELDGGEPDTFVDEYYWANIGTYIIEEPTAQEQQTVITLRGADILANAALSAFTDGQSYPRTVLQILQYACTQAGITLKSTTFTNSTESIATKPVWESGTTCRDIIGYIACLGAGFARIDRDGELEIIGLERNAAGDIDDLLNSYFTYTDGVLVYNSDDTVLKLDADGADLTADPDGYVTAVGNDLVVTAFWDGDRYYVYPSRYKTLTRQGAIFGPFNSLSVYEYGAPNGTGATRTADDLGITDTELNSIAVQGNPLLGYDVCDTIMANMLSALSGLTFNGGTIDWQGDPTITTGDFVDVYDLNDTSVPLLVLKQTLTFGPGFGMSSGNQINTAVKGKAKVENLRVFTPTGKLNAAALDGDITIKAGEQLNLLAGGNIIAKAGADIDIEAGGGLTIAGGTVDVQTNDFTIQNAEGQSLINVLDTESGGSLVLGESGVPIEFGGNFVLGVLNGGTGEAVARIHRGTLAPTSGIGQNGDLYIFHSGASSGSWSDTTLSPGSAGQATRFGVTRNWNVAQSTGYYYIGNGVGDSTYDRGAHFSFTAPAATKGLTFEFYTAKKVGGTTLSGGVTNYVCVMADSSYSIIATSSCSATTVPQTPSKQTVTLTAASDLTSGNTYYVGIYFTNTTEGNTGVVCSSVTYPFTLMGATGGATAEGLYVKSNGAWVAI